MKKAIWILLLVMGITACGHNNSPTDDEIRAALAALLNQKGCASSLLFNNFPIKKSMADANENIIIPFMSIGFIQKNGDSYVLTEIGRRAYNKSSSGFCYTDHYNVSDISVVKEVPKNELPPMLSGAWYVTFKISPSNVEEWVNNRQIIQVESSTSFKHVAEQDQFTVRMAKKHGEDRLFIADPSFSYTPGIHFNMGW